MPTCSHHSRLSWSAGYAPSDMPVKAKRSTYNYSLPITVKKMRECLCSPVALGWFALTLRDTEEDGPLGPWGRGSQGAAPGCC